MAESISTVQRSARGILSRVRGVPVSTLMRSAWPPALRLGGAFLQLLTTVMIARLLGAEAAGIYFFWAAAVMEAGQVATFGLDRVALRQVPRLDGDSAAIARFLGSLRVTTLGISLLMSLGLMGYAVWGQAEISYPPWWYLLVPVGTAGVTLTMIHGEAMAGLGRPVLAIAYRHTISAALLVTAIAIFGRQLTPELALLAYAGAFFVSGFGALAGPGYRRLTPAFRWPSLGEFRGHLGEGLPIFLSSLLAGLAFMVPLAILERTHPSDAVAFVTTAIRLVVLFDVLARAIYSLLMPELSRAAHTGDMGRLKKIYLSALMQGVGLLGLPMVGIAVFARPVMEIFGEGFGAGAPVLQLLMLVGLISLLLGPTHHFLLMLGRTRQMAQFSFVQFLVSSLLGLWLVPDHGPEALAAVLGAGLILEKILYLWYGLSIARSSGRESREERK